MHGLTISLLIWCGSVGPVETIRGHQPQAANPALVKGNILFEFIKDIERIYNYVEVTKIISLKPVQRGVESIGETAATAELLCGQFEQITVHARNISKVDPDKAGALGEADFFTAATASSRFTFAEAKKECERQHLQLPELRTPNAVGKFGHFMQKKGLKRVFAGIIQGTNVYDLGKQWISDGRLFDAIPALKAQWRDVFTMLSKSEVAGKHDDWRIPAYNKAGGLTFVPVYTNKEGSVLELPEPGWRKGQFLEDMAASASDSWNYRDALQKLPLVCQGRKRPRAVIMDAGRKEMSEQQRNLETARTRAAAAATERANRGPAADADSHVPAKRSAEAEDKEEPLNQDKTERLRKVSQSNCFIGAAAIRGMYASTYEAVKEVAEQAGTKLEWRRKDGEDERFYFGWQHGERARRPSNYPMLRKVEWIVAKGRDHWIEQNKYLYLARANLVWHKSTKEVMTISDYFLRVDGMDVGYARETSAVWMVLADLRERLGDEDYGRLEFINAASSGEHPSRPSRAQRSVGVLAPVNAIFQVYGMAKTYSDYVRRLQTESQVRSHGVLIARQKLETAQLAVNQRMTDARISEMSTLVNKTWGMIQMVKRTTDTLVPVVEVGLQIQAMVNFAASLKIEIDHGLGQIRTIVDDASRGQVSTKLLNAEDYRTVHSAVYAATKKTVLYATEHTFCAIKPHEKEEAAFKLFMSLPILSSRQNYTMIRMTGIPRFNVTAGLVARPKVDHEYIVTNREMTRYSAVSEAEWTACMRGPCKFAEVATNTKTMACGPDIFMAGDATPCPMDIRRESPQDYYYNQGPRGTTYSIADTARLTVNCNHRLLPTFTPLKGVGTVRLPRGCRATAQGSPAGSTVTIEGPSEGIQMDWVMPMDVTVEEQPAADGSRIGWAAAQLAELGQNATAAKIVMNKITAMINRNATVMTNADGIEYNWWWINAALGSSAAALLVSWILIAVIVILWNEVQRLKRPRRPRPAADNRRHSTTKAAAASQVATYQLDEEARALRETAPEDARPSATTTFTAVASTRGVRPRRGPEAASPIANVQVHYTACQGDEDMYN